jgi:hypothetical protein
VDCQNWIEQVREVDAVRFRDQAKETAVAVETPGPALLDDLKARLIMAVEQLVGDAPSGIFIG